MITVNSAYTIEELKEKIFSGEIEESKTVSSLMAYAVKVWKMIEYKQ